jgi:hypothetical protein
MNQSFDAGNSYHLPRLPQNESTYLRTSRQSQDIKRSLSHHQTPIANKASITQKIVMMEDIRAVEEYDAMN